MDKSTPKKGHKWPGKRRGSAVFIAREPELDAEGSNPRRNAMRGGRVLEGDWEV